ncbi:hypothetical protein BC826DRAFT_508585 [Russula brevipes]|nr:hypothetical protein BC826DRAFT_508585 [Russula brevipes]
MSAVGRARRCVHVTFAQRRLAACVGKPNYPLALTSLEKSEPNCTVWRRDSPAGRKVCFPYVSPGLSGLSTQIYLLRGKIVVDTGTLANVFVMCFFLVSCSEMRPRNRQFTAHIVACRPLKPNVECSLRLPSVRKAGFMHRQL